MGYLLGPRTRIGQYRRALRPCSTRSDTAAQGQYVDGLRAPVVIHPETEAHSYDEEFTVVLGDWYHDEHSVLLDQFVSIANPGGAEPVPGLSFALPPTADLH